MLLSEGVNKAVTYVKNKLNGQGFYVHYPAGFDRKDVDPHASGWFAEQKEAEAEMVRLATLTNKAFMVIKVVSKCVPWMYPNDFQRATEPQDIVIRQGGDA